MTTRLRRAVAGVAIAAIVGILLAGISIVREAPITVDYAGSGGIVDGRATAAMYWVPLTAPLEELDAAGSTGAACSRPLTQWLTKYGTPLPSPQPLLLRTTSHATENIAFTAVGSFASPQPGLLVQCGTPSIPKDDVLNEEFAWTPVLFRLEQRHLQVLTPTTDGPVPMDIMVTSSRPLGLLGILQGNEAFEGRIVARVNDTDVLPVPFLVRGADPAFNLSWPGIPSHGTLRVVVDVDYDNNPGFYCRVASGTIRGGQCFASDLPEDNEIRAQAEEIRADYLTVRATTWAAHALPRQAPDTESRTTMTRVDPWSVPALDEAPVIGPLGACVQNSYRADRVDCSANAHCYLNKDATKAACPSSNLSAWRVLDFDDPIRPAARDDAAGPVEPIALRLSNGYYCTFHASGPDVAIDGWAGAAGTCADDGGENGYPFWSSYPNGPLEQPYLFTPGDNGYLRIAVGTGTKGNPDYEDVVDIFY